jgi:hypothetical protein
MTLRRLMIATCLLAAMPAWAQGNGNGNGRGNGNGGGNGGGNGRGGGPGNGRGQQGGPPGSPPGGPLGGTGGGRRGPPRLGAPELQIIQGWHLANPGWAPVALPPGQRRRLAQGKPLPPGIARQVLPPGLVGALPAYPGHAYYAIGTDVVLVAIATGVIVSILAGGLGF